MDGFLLIIRMTNETILYSTYMEWNVSFNEFRTARCDEFEVNFWANSFKFHSSQ